MFDLTDEDLAGEDKVAAVPEGETGKAIDASIDEENTSEEDNNDEDVVEETSDEVAEENEADSPEEEAAEESNEEEGEEDDETAHYRSLYEHLNENGLIEVGEEDELDPSNKGLESVLRKSMDNAKSSGVSEYINGLGEEAQTMLKALEAGASMEDIKNGDFSVEDYDFSKVELYDPSGVAKEMNMIHLVEDQMIRQGYSEEDAQERALEIKEAGLLEKDAERAKRWLVDYQEKHKEETEDRLSKMAEKKAEEEARMIEDRKREVSSMKEIAGFKISQSDADNLYDYTYKKVGPKGETQYQLDVAKKDGAEMLPFYLAMKGFDIKSITNGVKTKQAIKLRKVLANSSDPSVKSKGKSMNGSSRGAVKSRDDLDLSAFDSIIGF